jgi:hypothetical protein
MRTLLFLAMTALVVPCDAQQTTTEGLACFENLAAPEFPKAALQNHVDGSVWTTTHVNAQGGVEKIDTEVVSAWGDGQKLLTPPVEKAIRAAKIKPVCAGKTVSVVFRYRLYGEATANPKVTSETEIPNIMDIESQPESSNQTTTSSRTPAGAQR